MICCHSPPTVNTNCMMCSKRESGTDFMQNSHYGEKWNATRGIFLHLQQASTYWPPIMICCHSPPTVNTNCMMCSKRVNSTGFTQKSPYGEKLNATRSISLHPAQASTYWRLQPNDSSTLTIMICCHSSQTFNINCMICQKHESVTDFIQKSTYGEKWNATHNISLHPDQASTYWRL